MLACSHTPSMKGGGLGNSFQELQVPLLCAQSIHFLSSPSDCWTKRRRSGVSCWKNHNLQHKCPGISPCIMLYRHKVSLHVPTCVYAPHKDYFCDVCKQQNGCVYISQCQHATTQQSDPRFTGFSKLSLAFGRTLAQYQKLYCACALNVSSFLKHVVLW